MNTLRQKIQDLENKIKEFGAKYSGDALTSHNEATQAALTVEVYKKQLEDLKKQLGNDTNSTDWKFYLRNNDNLLEITVSSTNIDPSKKIISNKSEIGQILLKSKTGDSVRIGEQNFVIEKSENIQ